MKKLGLLCSYMMFLSTWLIGGTFYIPHIPTDVNAWSANLIADNLSKETDLSYTVILYDTGGSVVSAESHTVSRGNTKVINLVGSGGVSGEIQTVSNELSFRLGYLASSASGGGTAEFTLSQTLYSDAVFSLSNYYDELTWSGFALYNGSEETAEVTAYIYDDLGKCRKKDGITLPPKTKYVNFFSNEFNVDFRTMKRVVFSTQGKKLTGITISGKNNDKLLFTTCEGPNEGWGSRVTMPSDAQWGGTAGIVSIDPYLYRFFYIATSSTVYSILSAVTKESGSELYQRSSGFDGVQGLGLAASADGSMLIASGTKDSKFWIAGINPSDGSVVWSKLLDQITGQPFSDRIQVASTGGTVAVNLRNNNGNMVRYLFNGADGVQLETQLDNNDVLPTLLVTHGNQYVSFWSRKTDSGFYALVTTVVHGTSSLSGYIFTFDESDILHDGTNHHVLLLGGYSDGEYVYYVKNISVGSEGDGSMRALRDMSSIVHPARFKPAENHFESMSVNMNGSLGSHVQVLGDSLGKIVGLVASNSWLLHETMFFEYGTTTTGNYLIVDHAATQPYVVDRAAVVDGKYSIGSVVYFNTDGSNQHSKRGAQPMYDLNRMGFYWWVMKDYTPTSATIGISIGVPLKRKAYFDMKVRSAR
jgi:hypothetical protein